MTLSRSCVLFFIATAAFLPGACNKAGNAADKSTETASVNSSTSANNSNPTASAESAAPSSISSHATIVQAAANGTMTTIRKGTNGWTCLPDAPDTPGPDPMCFDANAGKWVAAWVAHKPPPQGVVGIMYMLEGGTDASNTDPYATKPDAKNNWIKTGPHIMVVGSKEILAGQPSSANPDTSVPYVMWAGTPYAHLMVPLKGS
jgi:hypothetical protein